MYRDIVTVVCSCVSIIFVNYQLNLTVNGSLYTLPDHLSSPPDFSGVRVTRSLVLYVCFVDRYPFVLFLLAIVLLVLLRYTDSDYPLGIFQLFLSIKPVCK